MKKFLFIFLISFQAFAAAPYITPTGCQQFTVTIPNNATSNSVTISAVGSLAFIAPAGMTCPLNGNPAVGSGYARLTSPTTVTAFRGAFDGTNTLIVAGTVVDATSNLLNSVQSGVITIPNGASSTNITITTINTNVSAVIFGGKSVTNSTVTANRQYPALIFTSTNLTATTSGALASGAVDIGYSLLEFQPSVLNQNVQHYNAIQFPQSGTLVFQNLTSSVVENNSFPVLSGITTTGNGAAITVVQTRCLNTSTNLDLRTAATGTGTNFFYCHVIEFAPNVVLNKTSRYSTAMSNTNMLNLVISPSIYLPHAFFIGTGTSMSGGSYATFAYTQIQSPTNLFQIRGLTSANATIARGEIMEFNSNPTLINLFMEGW